MNIYETKKAVTGFGYITLSRYLVTGLRFAGGIYLARMIDPRFFGQQGLATSTLVILWSFVMIGQVPAIIRRQDNIETYVSTHVTIRLTTVFLLTFVLLFLWKAQWLPGSRQVQGYTLVLFATHAPSQVTSIYHTFMQKQMLFKRIAILDLASGIAAVLVACTLAYLGYTIWALLWLIMAENLARAVLTFIFTPKRFLPRFHKEMILEFFHYSKYIVLSSLMDRVHGKVDDLSVGHLVGEAPLGFYQRAYGLGGLLGQTLIGGITTIVGPLFSRMQGDCKQLGRSFELVGSLIMRFSVGAYFWMALVLPDLITVIYGEKWLPTVALFRLMLPFALLQGFRGVIRNTHQIAGSISLLNLAQLFELLALLAFMYPLLRWKQAAGVAVAVDISAIIGVGSMLFYLRRYADFSIRTLFLNPLLAGGTALMVFYFLSSILHITGRLPRLFLYTIIFVACYGGALLLLEFGFLRQTYVRIRQATRS